MNSISAHFYKGRNVLLEALRALALHRLRSLLAVFSFVFAVAAIVAMLAIAEGAKIEALEQVKHLGLDSIIIRNALKENDVPDVRFGHIPAGLGNNDIRAIKQIPGVERITFARESHTFLPEVGESDVISTLEVNHDYFPARGLRLAKGRFISDTDVRNRHQVCVLGAALARRIEMYNGGLSSVHINAEPYRIVGILRPLGHHNNDTLPLGLRDYDNAIFIPLHDISGVYFNSNQDQFLSEIVIKLSDARFIGPASATVRHVLLWNRDGIDNFELVVPKELLAQARRTRRVFDTVLGSIAGISLLVGGIGVMNIMLANVSERTREIGIRRAIGAKRRHIAIQFLVEAILLTVIGGTIGIALGSGAALSLGFFVNWRISISAWSVFLAVLMSVGAGIGAGIYPAVKASHMNPVDALRHI